MSRPLKVLHLEDDALASELVEKCLEREKIDAVFTSIVEFNDYERLLQEETFDVLLVDYSLPSIDGITALDLARKHAPNTPFIFVSGSLGEEVAIDCLKKGATDYVLKDGLPRLGPAIRRAIREASEHADRLQSVEGSWLWFETTGQRFNTAEKEERGVLVLRDITDTGCGMDGPTQERIFEPFFTTKDAGEGTGLGLSAVHGIVQNHRGAITVYSEPDRGTTFHVYFPLEGRGDGSEEQDDPGYAGSGMGQRIVLVDDKIEMVEVGAEMLELLGYRVTTYTQPEAALEAIRHAPQDLDLLITDLTMPRMTGKDLAREVGRIRPDLPLVLSSGFRGDLDRDKARELGFSAVLGKPYNLKELSDTINDVFEELAGGPGN